MKSLLTYFFLICLSLLFGCDNDDDNGNLLVRYKSSGKVISQASIYLKQGVIVDPGIPLDQYDFMQRADGTGEAYFKDIPPGDYFIRASGFDPVLQQVTLGDATITIVAKHRQNKYDVTVEAK